jgi:hypothetical protein
MLIALVTGLIVGAEIGIVSLFFGLPLQLTIIIFAIVLSTAVSGEVL